jgi:ParB-like chromosome segregation protein Spo0J
MQTLGADAPSDFDPMASFDHDLMPGNVKRAAAEVGAKSRDLWQYPIDSLRILAGFNPRVHTQQHASKIRQIADSIKDGGFHQNKPLGVFVAVEDGEIVRYVYDGHRRLEAAKLARSEGAEIEAVPCVPAPPGTTLEDLTAALYTDNNGEPLSPYETGLLAKRFVNFGWDIDRVSAKLNLVPDRVKNLLFLVGLPASVRGHVIDGRIAADEAIKVMRRHGAQGVEVIARMIDSAAAQGKPKATAKHAPDARYRAAVKKATPGLLEAVRGGRNDPGFGAIGEDLRSRIEALIASLDEATRS